jgi:uncharacterized protein (DUF1501 family)
MTDSTSSPDTPDTPENGANRWSRPPTHPEQAPMHVAPKRSRRSFLGLAAAGAVTAGGAAVALGRGASEVAGLAPSGGATTLAPTTTTTPLIASADVAGRTLIVVELQGGNDGLATLVPRNAGALYDRRSNLHIPDEELLDFTDEFGLNPNLSAVAPHGLAALMGIGTVNEPDGSHFEMERRWWAGKSSGGNLPATGFLGRLCDQLDEGQPVTGVSLGSGATPALLTAKATTLGLTDPDASWFLRHNEDPWFASLRAGLNDMAVAGQADAAPRLSARSGLSDTLAFADSLNNIEMQNVWDNYPGSNIGRQFGLASELLQQEAGLRVIHLSMGSFDTHSDQRGDHDYLLMELSEAMSTFLTDIGERGLAEKTLVCTTSEFGRRLAANGGGTDHGAAGMAFLAGPVNAGTHGEAPSLTNLDDGNLVATVDFENYYATLAEQWFGIPSSEVLESSARPIDGLLTT